MTLRTRFLRALLLVALPPALVAVAIFGLFRRNSLARSDATGLREGIGRSGRRLEAEFDEGIDRVLRLAREPGVVADAQAGSNELAGAAPAAIRSRLVEGERVWRIPGSDLERDLLRLPLSTRLRQEVEAGRKELLELLVTDPTGRLIAASARTSRYDRSEEEWWRTAWDGGRGALFVGDVRFDSVAKVASIDVAAPVRNETGGVSGVMKGVLDIRRLLEESAQLLGGAGAGLTLFSRSGARVHVGPTAGPWSDSLLDRILAGDAGTTFLRDPVSGAPVTAAFRPVRVADREGLRRAGQETYFIAAHRPKPPITTTWPLLGLLALCELLLLVAMSAAAWRIAGGLEEDLRGLETALGAAARGEGKGVLSLRTGGLQSIARVVDVLRRDTRASIEKTERLTGHLRALLGRERPSRGGNLTGAEEGEDPRGPFLRGLSEEMRAHRAAVHSLAELLSACRESPAMQSQLLGIVEGETKRLNDLLQDILDLSLRGDDGPGRSPKTREELPVEAPVPGPEASPLAGSSPA